MEEIIVREDYIRSTWGVQIKVKNQTGYSTIVGHNDQNYFLPASNNKVKISYSASPGRFLRLLPLLCSLEKISFSIRPCTSIIPNVTHYICLIPVFLASICIKGSGDPSLTLSTLQSMEIFLLSQGWRLTTIILDQIVPFPRLWEIGPIKEGIIQDEVVNKVYSLR